MKKAAFILFTVFLIFSCDAGNMNKLTITYNGNGHTSGDVPIDTNKYSEGAEAVVSDAGTLEKDGFSFAGWQYNDQIFKPGDPVTMDGNIEFTAKWNERKYRVIYDGNGNTEGEVPVDDNLYADGDELVPQSFSLSKNNQWINFYEVIGAKQVKNPRHPQFNKQWAGWESIIIVGNSNIVLRAIYNPNTDLMNP